jgi:hypothetical protein
MAQLPGDITETINILKQQTLEIVELATATESALFEAFGETEETLPYRLEFDMKKQPRIPNIATRQRLLANLRQTRLEIEALNLELAKIIGRLEECDRQQSRSRR